VTLIGGKDLKFNDLNMIDFLLQNNNQIEKPYQQYSMRSKGAAAAPMMALESVDVDEPINNNALDNLFVYRLNNITLLPKSRSSHLF